MSSVPPAMNSTPFFTSIVVTPSEHKGIELEEIKIHQGNSAPYNADENRTTPTAAVINTTNALSNRDVKVHSGSSRNNTPRHADETKTAPTAPAGNTANAPTPREVAVHIDPSNNNAPLNADETKTTPTAAAENIANALSNRKARQRAILKCLLSAFSILGTGFTGHDLFQSIQYDIKTQCEGIALGVSNTTHGSELCYGLDQKDFIVNKCVEKMEVTTWARGAGVMSAAIPVVFYVATKCICKSRNSSRIGIGSFLKPRYVALPLLNFAFQFINAFALIRLGTNHLNDRCRLFCTDSYSVKSCAVDRSARCTDICQNQAVFGDMFYIAMVQTIFTGIFSFVRARKSERA